MIINRTDPRVAEKVRNETDANPLAGAILAAAEAMPDPFDLDAEGAGLDIRASALLPSGLPNRARMKVFSPKPGHTLVFFYKKSLVPYSRDRYSYGGIDLRTPQVETQEIAAWLAFLTFGFHPDTRPANLRRAFPYEIPE